MNYGLEVYLKMADYCAIFCLLSLQILWSNENLLPFIKCYLYLTPHYRLCKEFKENLQSILFKYAIDIYIFLIFKK